MQWWNLRHGWDGYSRWQQYQYQEPGRMGPNALPVPDIRNGSIGKTGFFETDIDLHFSSGDKTQNLFVKLHLPIAKNVALELWDVPYEQYQTDTVTRDHRAARGYTAEGSSTGDVYIATLISLVQNHTSLPDITLEIALKTASGNNLEDARFTDAPGYYFDLSFGKKYLLREGLDVYMRPYGMFGFYVYQTHRDDYFQNDCILWGGGLDIGNKRWELKNQVGGYHGYFGTYDRPVVYRLLLKYKLEKIQYQFQFQNGNGSYPFTSFRFGAIFKLYEK